MTTFLQTSTGDLALSPTKQLQILNDPDREAAQKLRNRFLSFLGEWQFDTRLGVPYFQAVFVKNPNLGILRQIFKEVVLSIPWVDRVTALDLSLDGKRQLTVTFQCVTQSGAVITGGTGQAFIVTIPKSSVPS